MQPGRSRGVEIVLLFAGQVITSTAVIFIKANTVHPLLFASLRLLGATVILSPFFVREAHRTYGRLSLDLIRPALIPGAFLAVHMMTWIMAARTTTAANANLIVNMTPLFMPVVVFLLTREGVRAWEMVGTLIALAGLAALGVPSFQGSRETLVGDVLAFGSMLFLATYLALARRNRGPGSVWIYVTPLYFVAGLICLAVSLFFTSPAAQTWSWRNILTLLGIVVGPTIIGHTAMNHAMGRLPTQIVGLSQLSQTIWAGLMAFLIFGEVPHPLFAVAAVCIAAGVVVIVIGGRKAAGPPAGPDSEGTVAIVD